MSKKPKAQGRMDAEKLMDADTSPDRRRKTPPDSPEPTPPAKKRKAEKPDAEPPKKPGGKPRKPKSRAEVTRDVAPTTGPGSRQCTATAKQSGERCKRRPIPGGNVCVMHGGKTPAVQRSARGRLAELVLPSIETLNHERANAKRSADRQRAANSILDRAGITRGHSAEVDAARALLLERILTIRAESAGAIAPPDPLEIVAEVIDEDDDEAEYGDDEERPDAGA